MINLDLDNFKGYTRTDKVWGYELCLINCSHYCAKILYVNQGWQCSLHSHPVKRETFFVLDGEPVIEHGSDPDWLRPEGKAQGDSLTIYPGVWHRFRADRGDVVLLEVSMPHSDKDVRRLVESGPILNS